MIRSFQKSCPALTLSLAALFSPHAGLAAPVAPEPGFVIASLNGSGAPNKAFSGDGVLLVGSDSCSYIDGRDIAFSADRLYVTGPCAPIGNWQGGSFVLKLLKDGSVDTTFGEQGLARVPGISAAQIVVDAGRPIVAGSGNGKFVVARLKTNGSLDTTFGSGGISVVDAPSVTGEYLTGMARQSDGKIVLVGTGTHSSLGSLFVTGRLTTAGAPDTSFSADGWDNTDFAEGTTDKAYDVAIGGDGKIVVAGYSWLAGGSDRHLAVVRYTTNGTKDSTFSVDGKATVQVPGASLPAANGVAVDSSGRVVLGGVAWFPDGRFAVGRLTSSGALDTAFGTGGFAPTNFVSASQEGVSAVAMVTASRIVVAGDATVGGQNQLAAARYVSTGLDTTYDVDGKVLVPVPDYDVEARALAHDTVSGMSFLLATVY